MNRRQLLQLAAVGGVTAATRRLVTNVAGAPRATPDRPRFYLQIIPSGGIDPVYGADPKTRRQVEPDIDVPYPANAIVATSGPPLGPVFAALKPWLPRLAIVNAFQQNSANHQSGLVHTTCCRTTAVAGTPTLFDLLGARREREAVGAVWLNTAFAEAFSPKYLGQPTVMQFGKHPSVLDHLDALDRHELGEAARALRREAASLAATAGHEATTADNLRDTAALLDAWVKAPVFAPPKWPNEMYIEAGRDFERALWLFEHGLARCVTIGVSGQEFDTHVWNDVYQRQLGTYLAGLLDRLFHELDVRSVDGRPLAAQTVVIVGSEIGRFPRLNAASGKDHFPQVPYLFFGPGFATGTSYGETDAQFVARPVSLASGRPERGGHTLLLDDIGTTLLELDGANPELFGYTGHHLRFLTS